MARPRYRGFRMRARTAALPVLVALTLTALTGVATGQPPTRDAEVLATIDVGRQPWAIAVTPDGGKLFVANRRDANVSVLDTATNKQVGTVSVGLGPVDIVTSPDGATSYVANGWAGTVSVIDNQALTTTRTIALPVSPYSLALSQDGRRLFATQPASESLAAIDTQSGVVTESVSLGRGIRNITLSPDGARAYIPADPCTDYPCDLAGKVYLVNVKAMTLLRTIDVVSSPGDAIVAPDNSRWYVSHLNGVDIYSTASDSFMATIPRVRWSAFAFSPNGNTLYATQYGSKSMVAIDTASASVFAKIALPPRPQGLAVSPDGSRVYVVSQVDGPVLDPLPGVVSIVRATVKPPPPPTITVACRATTVTGSPGVRCSGVTTDIAPGTRLTAHTRTPPARQWATRDSAVVRSDGTFAWSFAAPKQRTIAVYFSYGGVSSAPVKVKLW